MKFKKFAVKMTVTAVIMLIAAVCAVIFLPNIIDGVFYLISLFAPFLLALIISFAANPLADKLQNKFKLPKGLTAVLVIILIVGIVGGALVGIIWKLVSEIKSLYIQVPDLYQNALVFFENLKNDLSDFYINLPGDIQNVFDNIGKDIKDNIAGFINKNYKPVMSGAGNFAKSLPSIFIGVIVFILSLYFMISDENTVHNFLNKLIPEKMLNGIKKVGVEIKKYLGGYVKAQLIIMSVAFVIIMVGLLILNVQYAMLIALGIAIFDALPFFGSGAILIPWAAIGFISGDIKIGIGMVIIYISLALTRQMIEPKIVSSKIGMNPLLTLMAMYVGYRVFSLGGMILGPILLMLIISFYKAGAFDGLIRMIKKLFIIIRNEIKELFQFITMR